MAVTRREISTRYVWFSLWFIYMFLLLLNYKHYIEGFVERIYAQIHAVSYDIKYACVPYVLRPLRLTIVELMDWEEEFVKYIWHFNKKEALGYGVFNRMSMNSRRSIHYACLLLGASFRIECHSIHTFANKKTNIYVSHVAKKKLDKKSKKA